MAPRKHLRMHDAAREGEEYPEQVTNLCRPLHGHGCAQAVSLLVRSASDVVSQATSVNRSVLAAR